MRRETFVIDQTNGDSRKADQVRCLRSIVEQLIEPYERSGHRVDVFLTVYRVLGGPEDALRAPFGTRLAAITTIEERTTPTQLLPLGAGMRAFLSWCHQHGETYDAVAVTRFDVLFKTDLRALMGDAATIDGFRLLWREAGGHWRHHADARTSMRTFSTTRALDWRRGNPRAPDALITFPFAYARCFLASVRNEFFPVRNETRPLSFMHNMVFALRRALPYFNGLSESVAPGGTRIPPGMQYLIRGQFDSNPCRATCMLNPVYDLLPRMRWVSDSGICQRPSDFTYDAQSDSLCCPSPNYCCPNSLTSCADPKAVLFDVIDANVSSHVIATQWPLFQARPFRWTMTPRSFGHVASVWRAAAYRGHGPKPSERLAERREDQRPWLPAKQKLLRAAESVLTDQGKGAGCETGPQGSTYCRG